MGEGLFLGISLGHRCDKHKADFLLVFQLGMLLFLSVSFWRIGYNL